MFFNIDNEKKWYYIKKIIMAFNDLIYVIFLYMNKRKIYRIIYHLIKHFYIYIFNVILVLFYKKYKINIYL